jgi:hypothetical protein
MNDVERRVGDRRQPVRQFGACLGFDRADEAAHHVVEHADLVFGKARGAVDEQIGDAGQDLVAAADCP